MKKKNAILPTKRLVLFSVIMILLAVSVIVVAALSYSPEKRADGKEAESITPKVSVVGDSAEVLIPEPVDEKIEDEQPREPFVPSIDDDEPFVDMETPRDFSKQYNYQYADLTLKYGKFDISDGVYTATQPSTLYAHTSLAAPFPYGTISADVMNNGSDSGIVFGLSSNKDVYWEGSGVSYYFAFISYEGILFLGKTDNGVWSSLAYTSITGFNPSKTYNLKVLYRVDKIILFLDDVPMVYFRTEKPLTGTGWGIRTGAVGAQISNIVVSNKVTVE